ncbi:unnamed protein product, partial [Prorocentrum cordatum]
APGSQGSCTFVRAAPAGPRGWSGAGNGTPTGCACGRLGAWSSRGFGRPSDRQAAVGQGVAPPLRPRGAALRGLRLDSRRLRLLRRRPALQLARWWLADAVASSREAIARSGQAVADGRPGTLYDEAIAQIARVMGLREGADGQRVRPRIRGYLQAVVFGHHPIHSVGERAVRELQTLAAAMDLLEDGSLASVADTLMQRFKALEMALNDGNWYIANELEVVEGIRPTLASRDEQESARRSAMLRRRLEEGGAVGAGATPLAAVGPSSRRGVAESALAEPRRLRARAARGDSPRPGAAAAPGRVELLGAPEVRAFRQDQPAAQAAWPDAGAPLAELSHTWQEKAGAAAESFRRPLDAGPILEELMREFPGALGVYVDKFIHSGHRPTRRGRLQRDLLPLPCPDLEASDFTVEEEIDPGDLASLQSRLRVIVMAMNWEAGYRHLKWADVCGPEPNAAQRSARLGIARRVYSSVAPEPAVAGTLDWSDNLKGRAIAYDGSEVSTPSKIALEQIEGGLPPVGVAASIEAADLAAGFVRAALLDPSLVLLPPAQRSWSMGRKLWAGGVETLRCGREAVCEENLHLLEEAGRVPAAGAGQEARAVYVGRGSRRWGLGPSKWGNPCPVVLGRPARDAVALFAGWLRSQPKLLDQLGELEGARLLCHCPSGEPCHANVLLAELEQRGKGCSRPFLEHQRVVASLVMTCHHSGADLRVDTDAETYGKMFPRQEIDAGIWKWKVARQLVWQDQAKHINVLECEAALMALRWRARSVSRQMCVFLHSMVNIGAVAKRRFSSQQLNKVVRAFSILELALGSRAVFAFTSSAKSPALSLPVTWDEMDLCLQDYLEYLWSIGASKGQANDTLSVAAAMAGWAFERNAFALAACILGGIHLCLRTGE